MWIRGTKCGQSLPVSRDSHIAETILFTDGISGTGKTLMGPILSSFARVEVQRMDHMHEYLCAVRFLGRMEEDAAVTMLRLCADLALYNGMLGRESNFRWKDLSGVLSNPRGFRYLLRLFRPDGPAALDRIRKSHPILHIHAHQILGVGQPLFAAFGERLRIVEMVRHPLYLIEHWSSYLARLGGTAGDLTVTIRHREHELPWFACGWEDKYIESNSIERAIYTVASLTQLADETVAHLKSSERQRLLVIPFEPFVRDPWPFLRKCEELLGTTYTENTRRALARQKVPRRISTDGIDRQLYRRYNWRPPSSKSTEESELRERWMNVSRQVGADAKETLLKTSSDYEKRYLGVEYAHS